MYRPQDIMQLLAEMMPALKRIKDEGQAGRNRINQYTRYFTIVIACVQSFAMADTATALNLLATGGLRGRAVIVPGT